jgi:hypothetical protein
MAVVHVIAQMNEGVILEKNLDTLSNSEKMAAKVIYYFYSCGVSFAVLLRLREVLVWQMEDGGMAFEYKFEKGDTESYRIIQNMKPKEKK